MARWGGEQADRYKEIINRALDLILANPSLGLGRDDLLPGLRMHTVREHRILYMVGRDNVRILRIIHVRQDEWSQLLS